MRASHPKRGFTLIELLVVIAIIGILSSIVLASLNTARLKSRDVRRVADLKQIQLALALYYDSNSKYPGDIYASGATALAPTYISVVPTDPLSPSGSPIKYTYAGLGSGTTCSSYHLGAALEDATNQALNSDSDDAGAGSTCTSGGTNFNGIDSKDCSTGTTKFCYDVMP